MFGSSGSGGGLKDKIGVILALAVFGGLAIILVAWGTVSALLAEYTFFDPAALYNPIFLAIVLVIVLSGIILWLSRFFENDMKHKGQQQYYSNRWMTKGEADRVHIYTRLSTIASTKQTGALLRFEQVGNDIAVNFCRKDYHSIILGTTGSGKTQGYILPYVYALGHSGQKPNMIVTDPKGEIYAFTAESLRRQGYDVQVFNLSEPSKSSRWNPFEYAWDLFTRAHNLDSEVKLHKAKDVKASGLRIISQNYGGEWYEFNGIAFPNFDMADMEKKTLRQRLLSEVEADIKDICAAICPVENERDPSWEMGARDLIHGVALAMLEDSRIPELGMTKERFNFYNIYKILSLRDNDPNASYASIKNYFEGRDRLSAAYQLASTVVTNAENTMKNFFGTATGKLSMFADKGICYITSGTEMDFTGFVKKPTAFFLIIPDQIKIRHTLATLCVSQLYKSLVRLANDRGGKLPWTTYFILEEFGNMPKLNDFATLVTVARGRNIQLTLVLQDYKQLETVYGKDPAVTIRNNCNVQIFIGVNDEETRKMFSGLMGEMAITKQTQSRSENLGKVKENDPSSGSKSFNTDTVSRPLLPPNELLDIKPGNIFVYCFGFHPLRSKVNMFYHCVKNGLVKVFKEPDEFVASKFFDEENIFYDIKRRNDIVLKQAKKNEIFDW
jgi:type IV secretion system protein VirD4